VPPRSAILRLFQQPEVADPLHDLLDIAAEESAICSSGQSCAKHQRRSRSASSDHGVPELRFGIEAQPSFAACGFIRDPAPPPQLRTYKLTLIIAIAALVMAAKQFMPSGADKLATTAAVVSISPAELTRVVGRLPESKLASLF